MLTQQELDSVLWDKLERYFKDRLATLRAKNDHDLDAMKTAELRGEIKEVKHILSLGLEKPEFKSAGPSKPNR